MRLYKSTMTIWTTYDPTEVELTELVHLAENVGAYCSSVTCALIPEPERDPAWDGTDFFNVENDQMTQSSIVATNKVKEHDRETAL